jgi:hypothetical protein
MGRIEVPPANKSHPSAKVTLAIGCVMFTNPGEPNGPEAERQSLQERARLVCPRGNPLAGSQRKGVLKQC